MKPSTSAVETYLKRNGAITGLEALRKLGCYRLSARILELRELGMSIQTVYETRRGKRFARYVYQGAA